MSRRCQRNHHRPKVFRWAGIWWAACDSCGWGRCEISWRRTFVAALTHSQELAS